MFIDVKISLYNSVVKKDNYITGLCINLYLSKCLQVHIQICIPPYPEKIMEGNITKF